MPKIFCKTFEYIEIPLTDAGIQKSMICLNIEKPEEVYWILRAQNGSEYALRLLYHPDGWLKSCREVLLTPEVRWYASSVPWNEKEVVEHARKLLNNTGDLHLAAFMVRDLGCTKDAQLTDLAWAMNGASSISRADVDGLLSFLEKYIRAQQ